MPVSLEFLARLAVFVFVVTSMLAMGLGLSLSQILGPFRAPRLVISALAANFVLVPLLAYFITRVLALDQPLAIGVLLLGTGAGAPFLPKLVEFARGDLGLAVGLMVMLMTATVLYMPIALPILLPVARVSPWPLAKPLVIVLLLPLTLGLSVRAGRPAFANRLHPYLRRTSTIALIFAVLLVLVANFSEVVRITNLNTILAGGLLLLVSFGCGYVLGGPSSNTRRSLAFGTAQRDISAGLLVAVENFPNPEVEVMLIVVALLGVCIQIPIALAFGRRPAQKKVV